MAARDVSSIPTVQQIEEPQGTGMTEIVVDSTNDLRAETQINGGVSTQQKPFLHLLSREKVKIYAGKCVPLYRAALKGDWEAAKDLLKPDARSMACTSITKGQETLLHIAAGARQTLFVEELLKVLKPQDLTLADKNGNSAFCLAAAAGATQIAVMMLNKNANLLTTRGCNNTRPVQMAALFAHRDMALLLYRQCSKKDILSKEDQIDLFFTCLNTGLYDLAMELLKDTPELAIARDTNQETALHVLARLPSAFAGRNYGLLKQLISSFPGMKRNFCMDPTSTQALQLVRRLWDELSETVDLDHTDLTRRPSSFVFDAAKLGNFEFLNELIRDYPEMVYEVDENNHTIFHIAVLYRHANVFSLIYEIGFAKEVIATFEDKDKSNILHLAAKLPHPSRIGIVSGEALQMQRELLWFKEIKKIVQPLYREKKNSENETPQELFSKEHKMLLEHGVKWMQKTANSCMLVATLIATVIFAAAFSVPGGNDNNLGIPIHLRDALFQVFAISNALALSSSSISILMFLSILISRYEEGSFLRSLPFKLMVGLASLFISVITMMVAFSATFFLAYHDRINWVTTITTILAAVPATLFVLLQYPLLRDIFCSTYRSGSLFKPCFNLLE